MEYIVYTDESDKEGKFFGNFYGGALVSNKKIDQISKELEKKKIELNLHGEIKWSKVTENYLEKYIELITFFFSFIAINDIKIRIMFTQNCHVPQLTKEQKDNEFFLLYYQFFKHAFGFRYCNLTGETIYLKPYFDQLPDTKEKNERFKDFIYKLQCEQFFVENNLKIRREDIAEVCSHDHVVLQCMDVVLGAMTFRLNDKHKEKPVGALKRGRRTIAKEKLYKHILQLIKEVYPGFNPAITTGKEGDWRNLWNHSYRHWNFRPTNSEYDETKTKPTRKIKSPVIPTKYLT